MGLITSVPKFERMQVYPGLSVIRMSDNKQVIGYVHKHPLENGWFYFVNDFFSPYFNTEMETIENLVRTFVVNKLDKKFDSAGLLNNEDYVQK